MTGERDVGTAEDKSHRPETGHTPIADDAMSTDEEATEGPDVIDVAGCARPPSMVPKHVLQTLQDMAASREDETALVGVTTQPVRIDPRKLRRRPAAILVSRTTPRR